VYYCTKMLDTVLSSTSRAPHPQQDQSAVFTLSL
jgi:hypothetical protein